MEWSFVFFFNSILLGVGLAMDAFSVSLANGLNEPDMKKARMGLIAGVFAAFQFLMPLIGWVCVRTILSYFKVFEQLIPWIALALLGYIGGKMLLEGVRSNGQCDIGHHVVSLSALLVQGVATSIDALSVGFTIADYGFAMALVSCLLIGAVTFGVCMGGLALGRRFGCRLAGKASILGGVILILIGIEIFVMGLLG